MIIKAIKIADFKRVRELEITDADRVVVVLGGKNGQGKSSALDAIAAALGGGKLIPAEPIRTGAESSSVEVTLDSGVTVRRSITRREDGTLGGSLTIRTSDGMSPRKPQEWLDARLGHLAVDPLAFLALHPDKQAERLRTIAGVDTSALDAQRRGIYADRADIGRDGQREKGALAVMPHHPDAPAAEVVPAVTDPALVSASPILAELASATEASAAADRAALAQREAEAVHLRAHEAAETATRAIADLERKLEEARQREVIAAVAAQAADEKAQAAALAATQARAAVPDAAPIKARLANVERLNADARAEATRANAAARAEADRLNAQIRANAARAAQAAKVERLREQYQAKTDAIAALDSQRAAMLAAAAFPVPGLGFDDSGLVTYQGHPLTQASSAEQLRVSMAIALSGDPEIRVVLIRDASLLDDDSMALVADMARERGAQVWLERVGDRDPGAIVIEDGGAR